METSQYHHLSHGNHEIGQKENPDAFRARKDQEQDDGDQQKQRDERVNSRFGCATPKSKVFWLHGLDQYEGSALAAGS
jgi:hypothetical protein